jgi:hypothetical protein
MVSPIISNVTTNVLELVTQQAFSGVNYMESLAKAPGGKDRAGINELTEQQQGILQPDVHSLFNKFTVFQYAGLYAGAKYEIGGHFIGHSSDLRAAEDYATTSAAISGLQIASAMQAYDSAADPSKGVGENKRLRDQALAKLEAASGQEAAAARRFRANVEGTLSNPTAGNLVKWGAERSAGTPVGYQPYSYSDFMYCTYYGKIPNNRLVTLRRYPYPVSDSLKLSRTDSSRNAIPTAQAVTWFGSDTGNDLNKMGVFSWDMTWKELAVEQQEITGNEVTVSDLLSILDTQTGPGGKALKGVLEATYAAVNGSDESIQQLTGYDQKIQAYQKTLYTTGPYWNRIYGPVNVVHKSSRRERGMQDKNWNTPIKINFSYKFRSFNGLSPKIAALDLISNFINLTYNDAQFLGQLARYYPKTGLKFNPTVTEAIGNILTNWGTSFVGNNSQEFSTVLENLFKGLELAGSKIAQDPLKVLGQGLQSAAMSQLKNAIPELISVRSALSDRPVGEWHIVVGNPVNPIFVMGDLVCSAVTMTWDQEMGPDDFPTGVTFSVDLNQGKPRDKTAIERMLNLGQSKLTTGAIRGSSTDDTFGDENNQLWNNVYGPNGSPKPPTTALPENEQDQYLKFKNRVLNGYGATRDSEGSAVNNSSLLDDSVLMLYYNRQYGRN